jgi:hypothetical protein
MWWAAVSRAVDQSSTRNKRNDRLAEGHDRVAGAAMVLRMLSDPGLLIGVCHCLFDSLGTFRRGRSLSDRQNEGRCGSRAVRPETSRLSLHYRSSGRTLCSAPHSATAARTRGVSGRPGFPRGPPRLEPSWVWMLPQGPRAPGQETVSPWGGSASARVQN